MTAFGISFIIVPTAYIAYFILDTMEKEARKKHK